MGGLQRIYYAADQRETRAAALHYQRVPALTQSRKYSALTLLLSALLQSRAATCMPNLDPTSFNHYQCTFEVYRPQRRIREARGATGTLKKTLYLNGS